MLLPSDDDGTRPAGKDNKCFYCQTPIDSPLKHTLDCVMRQKTMVVEVNMHVVISCPASWDAAMIEFHRNDGTWCADNFVHDLHRWVEQADDHHCPCGATTFKVIRDASPEDHERLPVCPPLKGD